MKLKSQVAALFLASSSFAWATPTLIHQYDFNGSGVIDSVGSSNGTLNGGASVSGGLLVLDGGDDYVDFFASIVPLTGIFSVQFDAQGFLNSGVYTEMISQGGGFYMGWDPSPTHQIRLSDTYPSTVAFPSDSLFHNYLLTSDGSGTNLFIDYTLVFHGASPLFPSGTDTRLGRQYGPHAEYFPGNMDNLSIYDGAFLSSEVHAPSDDVPDAGSTLSLLMISGATALVARFRRKQA